MQTSLKLHCGKMSEKASNSTSPNIPKKCAKDASVDSSQCVVLMLAHPQDPELHSNLELAAMNAAKEYLGEENESKWKEDDRIELVALGPNGTVVPAEEILGIEWNMPAQVTRKLLQVVFDRNTLATHTLSGKTSPAFQHRPNEKEALDQSKIADVIHAVQKFMGCSERDVRIAITTKCADESKMLRKRLKRIRDAEEEEERQGREKEMAL